MVIHIDLHSLKINVFLRMLVEMIIGRQVEFPVPIHNVYPASEEGRSPQGVIVEKVKDWQFVIRFHDEVVPKQRVVSFNMML